MKLTHYFLLSHLLSPTLPASINNGALCLKVGPEGTNFQNEFQCCMDALRDKVNNGTKSEFAFEAERYECKCSFSWQNTRYSYETYRLHLWRNSISVEPKCLKGSLIDLDDLWATRIDYECVPGSWP